MNVRDRLLNLAETQADVERQLDEIVINLGLGMSLQDTITNCLDTLDKTLVLVGFEVVKHESK